MKKITKDRELTPSIIEEIKTLNADGLPKREIMNKTGCTMGLVTNVIDKAMKDAGYQKLVENGRVARINSVIKYQQQDDGPKKRTPKRDPITDEQKIDIALDYQTGKFTQAELSEKYDADKSTVSRVIRELIPKDEIKKIVDSHRHKKDEKVRGNEVQTETQQPSVESASPETGEIRSIRFPLSVGLINGRHPMPVDTYIFDLIPQSKINDFNWQETIVENFISKEFSNKYNGLIVYLSGLQSALATVIKVCNKHKITLWLAHHRAGNCYDLQLMLKHNGGISSFYKKTFHQIIRCDNLYTFDCELEEISELEEHFMLEVLDFDQKDNLSNRGMVICRDIHNAMDALHIMQCIAIERNHDRRIYLRKNSLTEEKDRFIGVTLIQTRIEI